MADAMQAAGPQLLHSSIVARPEFNSEWVADQSTCAVQVVILEPSSSRVMPGAADHWHVWQTSMLQAMLQVVLAFIKTGPGPQAPGSAAAAAPTAEPPAAAGASASSSSSCGIGSSGRPDQPSGAQQVSWGYLLQLQQCSRRWAAALAAFDAKWPGWRNDVQDSSAADTASNEPASSNEAMQQTNQRFTDALELCRALAAAAPLPLVCNNPGCQSLARVSEAAAASKRCARCRCSYCSAACQTADWERHKPACKRMAAAGLTCV
uniref:phytol kinase n=1 Tax=Tetradesmus obliquus TaxID=3088 RepID=A0A383WQ00_TETOB